MNRPGTLSPPVKKEITNDWGISFPLLGIYRPMWLLKRHGPLLMGISLDCTRSNDVYLPTFHVHNLLAPWPAISLSLIYSVPDPLRPKLARQIKVPRHREDYLVAVEFLRHAVPELMMPVLTWPRLVQLYADFIRQKRDYAVAQFCQGIFLDIILLAHWCGQEDYARECETEAVRLMESWSPAIDVVAWSTSIRKLIGPDTMRRTLESEMAKHKIGKLPVYELNGIGEAESIAEAYALAWA